MLHTIYLKGRDPHKVAQLIGGTLIMVNVSDDTAMIAGGDLRKLAA
jgi:hypothetical protein